MAAPPAPAEQVCPVTRAATVPLRIDHGFAIAAVTVEDREVDMLIDTGSEVSMVTPSAVTALRLHRDPFNRTTILGTGGAITTQNARLQSFGIGGMVMRDQSLAVGTIGTVSGPALEVGGLLGADWLSDFDVDLDVPRRLMTLYRVPVCSGTPAPWPGAVGIPVQLFHRGLITLPAVLDGHQITALLDSGANGSVVDERQAGLDAITLAHDPVSPSIGVDGNVQTRRQHRFADLQVAGTNARDVAMSVGPLQPVLPGRMLLGMDWLRAHRVWIAYGARRMFVQRR